MRSIVLTLLALCALFASEDMLKELFPQKKSYLTQEELDLLQQSLEEHSKQDKQYKESRRRIQNSENIANQDGLQKKRKSIAEVMAEAHKNNLQNQRQNGTKEKRESKNDKDLILGKIEDKKLQNQEEIKSVFDQFNNNGIRIEDLDNNGVQEKIRASVENGEKNPYLGVMKKNIKKDEEVQIIKNQNWIYGVSVITTTFLDGSIKRSYGILLKDGLFLTSANMVYDKNIYPRESYAMMQDDSSIPFIYVAKLSIKALDLKRGLAILETSSYTDMYGNPREKSFYHDRIYSNYWVDIFEKDVQMKHGVVYSPYISDLNSFYTRRSVVEKSLEALAKEESRDFEGYKYAYGKGYFTLEGKLIGIVGASKDGEPRLKKREEIAEFLCELKEKKILQNLYLQNLCSSSQ